MARRYAAMVGECPDRDAADRLRNLPRILPDFRLLADTEDCILVAERSLPTVEFERGILLGSIFRHDSGKALQAFTEIERRRIEASRGASLMKDFWGNYLVLLDDKAGSGAKVLRSPFGDLPCYFTNVAGATALASDVALLESVGLFQPEIDWSATARHLAQPEIRWTETCLAGLQMLPGGTCISSDGRLPQIDPIWSPWPFAVRRAEAVDADSAARHVRQAVCRCTAARAAPYAHSLLLLSGGLDSSVVAAALARSRASFTCLTLVSDDPAGDERHYARLVAEAVGAPLLEIPRQRENVDIGRSSGGRTPFPFARGFAQEAEAAALDAARGSHAAAVFDGGGGDNVFYGLLSVAPLADCLRVAGPDRRFWSTARSLADLSETGLWTVVRRAVHRAWLRSPRPRVTFNLRFLSARGKAALEGWTVHPWLCPPEGALPGKASQVALLAPAQGLVEVTDPLAPIPFVAPLVSQPVVEACMAAPSWLWFAPGRNRALARQAFSGDLPPAIVNRRSKGTPNAFVAGLYEANRLAIRAMLLDGCIAAHGLLDVDEVRRVLDDHRPVRGFEFARIMELVDAEAWARLWV